MDINFYKYQGAGNDFILIDHRMSMPKDLDYGLIARLCHRRFSCPRPTRGRQRRASLRPGSKGQTARGW